MKDVYIHLLDHLPSAQLQELLHNHCAIFLPSSPDAVVNIDVLYEGGFVGTSFCLLCGSCLWLSANKSESETQLATDLRNSTKLVNDLLTFFHAGRNDVRWCDPSGIFGRYKKSLMAQGLTELCRFNLRGVYSDMEEFFTRAARVEFEPTLQEWTELLKHIANTHTVQNALADILQV